MMIWEDKCCGSNVRTSRPSYTVTHAIVTPEFLPNMLRTWFKAAIRTRPSDLLRWCATYSRMKADGEYPPVRPHVDPLDRVPGPGGLTTNSLKALAVTLSNERESREKIEYVWELLSLERRLLLEIIEVGGFTKEFIDSKEFLGTAAAYLTVRLRDTMILLCKTFSVDGSQGMLLKDFVACYQFLARLECVVEEVSLDDENTKKMKRKASQCSLCFSCSDSQSNSSENENGDTFCDSPITEEEKYVNLIDTESTRGIMAWPNEYLNEPESFTELVNKPIIIKQSIDTKVCFDADVKNENKSSKDDDILSLLSSSSITFDPNPYEISFLSSSETIVSLKRDSEINCLEEENSEKTTKRLVHSVSDNLCLDKKSFTDMKNDGTIKINYDNNDNSIEYEPSDENNVTSNLVEYEDDGNNDAYIEMKGKKNTINVNMNKDFIVMLALIDDKNGPTQSSEPDENQVENESSASETSLLKKIKILERKNDNPSVNNTDDENENNQAFKEDYYMDAGKESSNSETSRISNEFQYSDVDQQSNVSVASENKSFQTSASETTSKDNLAFKTGGNELNMDQLLINDQLLMSTCFEMIEMEEEAERYYDPNDKSEKYLNISSKNSTSESVESKSDNTKSTIHSEKVRKPSGVGPTITEKRIKNVIEWVTKCANGQNDFVQEENLLHFLCPPLDNWSKKLNKRLDIV